MNYSIYTFQALGLATQALFLSNPNPRVGCVLVGSDGSSVLGQGFTQRAGQAHAEVMALRAAADSGHDTRGATAYVTLEPCAHHGRTGPCCDALIAAGVARVVASLADPNPLVAGQGFERLRAAGVAVDVGELAQEARELNIGFFSRMVRRTPWVRMKLAASMDGVTALPNGVSQWITSPEARADGHAWRARACAVLTGIGTVLEDDPRLDVREVFTFRQPHLVLVDSQLQTPLHAQLWKIPERKIIIYGAVNAADEPAQARRKALEDQGATVIVLRDASGKVDLTAMMSNLATVQLVNELHVEAGFKLNGSLAREGLVDEFLVYQAPLLLGTGLGMVNMGPLAQLADGITLEYQSMERVGPDLRIVARPPGRGEF